MNKISKKNIIAFIPARGGSKGVKLKNLKKLGGVPLVTWAINSAKKEKIFNKIFVSSDNNKILKIALNKNVEIHKRPKKFARDKTTIIDTVKNGPFWISDYNEKKLTKIMENIDVSSLKNWNKINSKYKNLFITYNYKNSIIFNKLKQFPEIRKQLKN